MTENKCPQCGAPLDPGATECKFCGEKIATQQAAQSFQQAQPQPQVIIQQAAPQQVFYLGNIGMGLLFCWTGIPAIVGLIEGIIYLCSNDENFQLKHHVRLQ